MRVRGGEEKLISSGGVVVGITGLWRPTRSYERYRSLGRIMKLNKANTAGLTSPQQQSEMKSILAGGWPPLKPLPVFKYETVEYRATIDFDKKRGEWVCRKTSLASNEVQELRGGLREITTALPHGEAETLTESPERQEQELEKDKNRRLQALREWREKYENGRGYFELRDLLSESQRSELDASLRLSLTARQLQFNAKNVASVFDDLSIAGGRFATLIEFAKRNKAKQADESQVQGHQVQGEGAVADAQRATSHDEPSVGISPGEFGDALHNGSPFVGGQDAAEPCTDADELPALSIKNVCPEPDQISLAERVADIAPQTFEIDDLEIVDADVSLLAEHPDQEGRQARASSGPARNFGTGQSSPERISGASRFRLEISALQVAAFAALFLFTVLAFTVGLTVGRGSFGTRLREGPKSTPASHVESPIVKDQGEQSPSRSPSPPEADPAATNRVPDARGSEYFAEVRSADSESRSTVESEPAARPEVESERVGGIGLSNHTPYRLATTIEATPHVAKPSAILVTVPSLGQPFRVSSPIKAIAATSSFAMISQLAFLVSPAAGATVAHQPARLEAGELVSFAWPRYSRPGTIRVRATIGESGQVLDVKFLSGSVSLLPATIRAVRQWRYRPTLLDKSPVQAQQDVTIEFRPPRYSPQMSTRRSSHNHN